MAQTREVGAAAGVQERAVTPANAIPEWSRRTVRERSMGRCERCGSPAAFGHWHHRRTRSVRDAHTHCPCNGIWLCTTCHRDVHSHPVRSQGEGTIVSSFEQDPGTVVVNTPWGIRLHGCDGSITYPSVTDATEGNQP